MTSHIIPPPGPGPARYDRVTVGLHWLTALLVVTLYGLAQTWGFPPRHSALHSGMIITHTSLGVALVATLAARILWRSFAGRKLPADGGAIPGLLGKLSEVAARAAHYALYVLLIAVVTLGFLLRWSQGHPVTFFGLFSIPSPLTFTRAASHQIHELHSTVATVIIILAGLHALAALFHHYVVRDDILRRMLPLRTSRQKVAGHVQAGGINFVRQARETK